MANNNNNNSSQCTSAGTWNVQASPDGSLIDAQTGKKYSYLFYEAKRKQGYPIKPDECFCVKGEEVDEFLEDALTQLGLNFKERNDFIVYWLPSLTKNKWNLIRFLGSEFTEEVELNINPKPDTLIRVFVALRQLRKKA